MTASCNQALSVTNSTFKSVVTWEPEVIPAATSTVRTKPKPLETTKPPPPPPPPPPPERKLKKSLRRTTGKKFGRPRKTPVVDPAEVSDDQTELQGPHPFRYSFGSIRGSPVGVDGVGDVDEEELFGLSLGKRTASAAGLSSDPLACQSPRTVNKSPRTTEFKSPTPRTTEFKSPSFVSTAQDDQESLVGVRV